MKDEFSEWAGKEVQIGDTTDRLGDALGEGAEGAVYELTQQEDRVIKIFKEDKRANKQSKIERMVQDSMITPDDQTDIPWTTWPIEAVSHPSDGQFSGYMMPYLDMDKYVDAQRYASQNLRWDDTSRRQRYKPAINLVLTVHWLHQNGYAIGDLSEQNIRVNDGNVTLIDCDSCSIEGSGFSGQMEAPRYTPPEGRGTTHQGIKQTDRFGVGVHILQFLMAGFHPYQAVGDNAVEGSISEAIQHGPFPYTRTPGKDVAPPPRAPDFAELPASVRQNFEDCFSTGQHTPSARPSLEKWLAVLSKEGDFDIEGLDLSDVSIEADPPESSDHSMQGNVNQGTRGRQAEYLPPLLTGYEEGNVNQGTRGRQAGASATASTAGSTSENHWADNLRREQTSRTSKRRGQQSTGQQSTGRQSTGQQSTDRRSNASYVIWATILVVSCIILGFLILTLVLIAESVLFI